MKDFEFPVKLPLMTSEAYEKSKADYTAKHGYDIHIPGFSDIFKWNVKPEPSVQEIAIEKRARSHKSSAKYYINKLGENRFNEMWNRRNDPTMTYTMDEYNAYTTALKNQSQEKELIALIGDLRYKVITEMRAERREKFMKMLANPMPNVAQNAGSILTFFDDVNDTLGTLACITRIVGNRLPFTFIKALATSGGNWLLTAAQVAGLAMELSRLPFKIFRIQNTMHDGVKGNPLSRKAKAKRMRKLRRKNIIVPELIEAAQTTDNMFGIGLCLGGIFSLLWSIPSGLYRHTRGEEVKVYGLPRPFYWFDRVWSQQLKNAASMWTGNWGIDDKTLGKSMVSVNMCFNFVQQFADKMSILDELQDPHDIEVPAPRPVNPLTLDVMSEEVGDYEPYIGWPETGKKWMLQSDWIEEHRWAILKNLADWWFRNDKDQEAMVCSQNAVEAAMSSIAIAEDPEDVEIGFDNTSQSILDLMNMNYRFPENATLEQSNCFAREMQVYDKAGLEANYLEAQIIARDHCSFEFTQKIPERYPGWYLKTDEERYLGIDRLRQWYWWTWMDFLFREYRCFGRPGSWFGMFRLDKYSQKVAWLKENGLPLGQPAQMWTFFDEYGKWDMQFFIPDLAARVMALYDPFPALKVKLYDPWYEAQEAEILPLEEKLRTRALSGDELTAARYKVSYWRAVREDPAVLWTINFILKDAPEADAIRKSRQVHMGEKFPLYDWPDVGYNFWASIMTQADEDWKEGWNFRKHFIEGNRPKYETKEPTE